MFLGIAAGANHGVLLKGDGSVWTWGGNGYGQLGTDGDDRWTPVRVPGLGGVRSVAAGEHFTMVLKADGTVWTWGQNEYGELGYGSKEDSPRPAAVGGLPRIVAIAAAGHHSLALDSNGTVWGWGDVPNRSPVLVPQRVPDLANVVAIASSTIDARDHAIPVHPVLKRGGKSATPQSALRVFWSTSHRR